MVTLKKASLRLNSRKKISLSYGNNSTLAPIESILDLKPFNKEDFKPISKQRSVYFITGKNAVSNNKVLSDFINKCEEIISNNQSLATPREIINAYLNNGFKQKIVITFDMFINDVINTLRYEVEKSTYKKYVTVRNNVKEYAPALSNKPISQITNKDFIALGDVVTQQAPNAYTETMKFFKATINKAKEKELNNEVLSYNWKKNTPVSTAKRPHHYINDITHVLNFDITSLNTKVSVKTGELYLDIAKFLYYSASRPIDVIEFRTTSIIEKDGVKCWQYTPRKKDRNVYTSKIPEKALVPISPKLQAIINKYTGTTGNEYLFPIPCNMNREHKAKEHIYNSAFRFEGDINKFLKDIGKALNLDFDLSLYDFRHTRTTDLCKKGVNIAAIAKTAGTSIQQLNNVYIDKSSVVISELGKLM